MPIVAKKSFHLLTKQEVDEIYGLPDLGGFDRKYIFSLNSIEKEEFSKLRTISSKVLFVMQLGFFKAKNRFYTIEEMNTDKKSKKYILQKYFPVCSTEKVQLRVSETTKLSQQSYILNLFNFKRCTSDVLVLVRKEATRLAKIHLKRSYIIREWTN